MRFCQIFPILSLPDMREDYCFICRNDLGDLVYTEFKTSFFFPCSFPSSPPPWQIKARETENMFWPWVFSKLLKLLRSTSWSLWDDFFWKRSHISGNFFRNDKLTPFFLIGHTGAISGNKKKIQRMTGERKKKVETCAYCGKDSCYAKLQ